MVGRSWALGRGRSIERAGAGASRAGVSAATPSGAALIAVVAALVLSSAGLHAQAAVCQFRGAPSALGERPSPLDSVLIELGDSHGKLCYSRPSARGRSIVGGRDRYGAPWRLGANEPTTLHVPFAARIGRIDVGPGSYSLYAVPQETSWTIVINGNTNRWGIPIGPDVRAADIGTFTVPVSRLSRHVETLEFTFEPRSEGEGDLVFRWEYTMFRIPIARR